MNNLLDAMFSVFEYILNNSIQVTLVILVVALVRLMLLKGFHLPKKYAYILWGVVVLRMVLVFTVSSPLSLFNVGALGNVETADGFMRYITGFFAGSEAVDILDANDRNADDNWGGAQYPGQNTNQSATLHVEQNVGQNNNENLNIHAGANDNPGMNPNRNEKQNLHETQTNLWGKIVVGTVELQTVYIAMGVWLLGISVLVLYMILSYYRTRKLVATAVRVSENVYECDNISSPFVFGLLKPQVYLPYGVEEKELPYILMHENYHIQRRDLWVKWIAFLLVSIYWFNPFVWVAFYLAMSDMEMSVDEAVLMRMNRDVKKEYCLSLLSFAIEKEFRNERQAHRHNQLIMGPLGFGESGASKRIKNVLKFKKPRNWLALTGIVIIGFIAVACLTNGTEEKKDETTLNRVINKYIAIEDTLLEHAYFTMTVPEDFVGKVSYAVLMEEEDMLQEDEIPLDYRIEFVLDEVKFYGEENSRDETVPVYGEGGTLGGITWWTVDDLYWDITEEEIAQYSDFAGAYAAYYPTYALGFEGRLLQTDAEGTGGYCETNTTDVQWVVDGEDTEKFQEIYLHYEEELRDARESFRSKAIGVDRNVQFEESAATGENAEQSEMMNATSANTAQADAENVNNEPLEVLEYGDVVFQARRDGIWRVNADGTELCLYEGFTGASPLMKIYENVLYFMTDLNYKEGNLDWSYNGIRWTLTDTNEGGVLELDGFPQSGTMIQGFYIYEGFISIQIGLGSYRTYLLPETAEYVGGIKIEDLEKAENVMQVQQLLEQRGQRDSEYLTANPGVKMSVDIRTTQKTYAALDMDMDGTVELVTLRADEEKDAAYYGRAPLDYFVLEVGDATLTGFADNLSNDIFAFSPDGKEIIIMLYEDGPSYDPLTHFYRYAEGVLKEIGTIDDEVRVREITEEGIICAYQRLWGIQDDWKEQSWRINEKHELEQIPQDSYRLLSGNDISLLCDLPLVAEPGGTDSIVVSPQVVHFMEVSADGKWILMETASGEQGWFEIEYREAPQWDYLINAVGKYANEVFEGLIPWAG